MSQRSEDSFWISYSDLATGLMIVFMVVMLLMMVISKEQNESKQVEIQRLAEKLEIILGTRAKLADSINTAFADNQSIKADPVTAQLTLSEDLLTFKPTESSLTIKQQRFLEEFAPNYICALWDHEYRECTQEHSSEQCHRLNPEDVGRVRRILITGHADLVGNSRFNHSLSADRAEKVVLYILETMRAAAQRTPSLTQRGFFDLRAAEIRVPERCEAHREAMWRYAQERLYGVGAGDLQHCMRAIEQHDASFICEEQEQKELENKEMRKVTFELELTGADMTGMLLDIIALQQNVEVETNEPLDQLRVDVLKRCRDDENAYHGCRDILRRCDAAPTDPLCQPNQAVQ
jgi:flagellar motor protein MotB